MKSLINHEPKTTVGRFDLFLDGREVKLLIKIYLAEGTLDSLERPTFMQGFKNEIRQTWEGKYGFTSGEDNHASIYNLRIKVKFVDEMGNAHFGVNLIDSDSDSVSRQVFYGARNLAQDFKPASVKLNKRAVYPASDQMKSLLSKNIIDSTRSAFPFYADLFGGQLSLHTESQLKLLVKQIKAADPATVLAVTVYGNNKKQTRTALVQKMRNWGLPGTVIRNSKKIGSSGNPRSGRGDYVKITIKRGFGVVDLDSHPMFRYPSTVSHEFGHMIGLVDEYRCLSKSASDKMAELDFIKANEQRFYEGYYAPGSTNAEQESQASQALLAQWAHDAGTEPAQYGIQSTSLMSSGGKLLARHMLTIRQALIELSGKSDWKIVKL